MTALDSVLTMVKPSLEALGYRKRAGAVFTLPIDDEFIGWLGLNAAREHLGGQGVNVLPIIGLRHQPTERLVAELAGRSFHAFQPPTIRASIGELMPGPIYAAWLVQTGEPGATVESMLDAVRDVGLPFVRANATLPELRQRIDDGFSTDQLPYRCSAAAVVAGDSSAAAAIVDDALRGIERRTDNAANDFRRFADKLLEYVLLQSQR